MKNSKQREFKKESLIPRLARKIGEKSLNYTCVAWIHQPKVPESMKNLKK